MKRFDNLPLAGKLFVLALFAVVLLAAGGVVVAGQVRQQMLDARLQQLRAITEGARSQAAALEDRVKAGELTHEQAMAAFVAQSKVLRYDNGSGYIIVNGMDGMTLVNPNTKIVGTNQLDVVTNGIAIARLLRDGVRDHGETVVHYDYYRPGGTELLPKITYATGFAPWDILIGSGAYLDDIDATFRELALRMGSIAAAAILAIAAFGWALTRRITRPLNRLEQRMRALAAGDLEAEVPDAGRRDEVGRMAQAVRVFRENALRVHALEQEKTQMEAEAKGQRATTLARLMREFEDGVGSVAQNVGATAASLRSGARSLTETAADTMREGEAVGKAGDRASMDVQTVASAAEELSASIGEIARQVSESSAIAEQAVADMGRTDGSVRDLADSAQRIGEIVALINGIATQTNLLALNATIEAARAGDAGKGFAVVASEVKALANQTARATEDIRVQIESMQTATSETVTAVRGITATIGKISQIAGAIAAAVQEQGTATQEIASNVQHVSADTREISASIGRVSGMAGRTGGEAEKLLSVADTLSGQAETLRGHVDGLLAAMRAA
jgi:methyl-accepting chemotaxis protein